MRITIALVIVIVIVIAVAVLAVGRRDHSGSQTAGAVTLVGDSLNVGVEPYLDQELSGWRIDAHDLVGRATTEGIEELRALGAKLAPVVVVSLGTNDPDGSEAVFRERVAEAIELVGPDRCLVWATIVRDGSPRTGFNDVLLEARSANRNVRLVDWAAIVADASSLLAEDLVHGTPEGYARRAEETARVVGSCPRAGG
jgi:hypothetical protein